jgi:hypothetical protein
LKDDESTLCRDYLPNYPGACGMVDIFVIYEWCNDNGGAGENIIPYAKKSEGKYKSQLVIPGGDLKTLFPNQCDSRKFMKRINTCVTKEIALSMKYSGYNANYAQPDSYCYAYQHERVQIKKAQVEPTKAPVKPPSKECKVSVKAKCTLPNGSDCVGNVVTTTEDCGFIPVKLDFIYCNKNENDTVLVREGKTLIRILGIEQPIDETDLEPMECRTEEYDIYLDSCRPSNYYDIKLEGYWTGGDDYCYDYDFLSVKTQYIESKCDDIIITEVADPSDSSLHRFVEIYSEKCKNLEIKDDLWLVRWTEDNSDISSNRINLKGRYFAPDGFLVFCVSSMHKVFYGTDKCDMVSGISSPADVNGDDHVAIVKGVDPSISFEIVDIFGVPGEDGTGTNHDFTNGRAVRKWPGHSTPKSEWDVDDWIVIPGQSSKKTVDSNGMDPHMWTSTPTDAPTQTPTSYPTTPTATPTAHPTVQGPTADPTANPTSYPPTTNPTNSKMPTPRPTPPKPPCDGYDVLITEIADPRNDDASRFVELHFSDCWGSIIEDDLWLTIWYEDDTDPSSVNPINLKGLKIPGDGFLVFCNTKQAVEAYGDGKCDYISGRFTPVDSNGNDQIAVVRTPTFPTDLEIVDIFGRPGEDGKGTDHDFTGGRAVRKTSVKGPNDVYDPNEWYVYSTVTGDLQGATTNDMDPHEWKDPPLSLIITEIADPVDDANHRFVELYTSNWAGREIKDDLYVVRWPEDSSEPSAITIPLKGMIVPADGFLVFCRDQAARDYYGDEKCDLITGDLSPANCNGDDHIAIVSGSDDNYKIVDLFGNPGVDGTGTNHDFTNGRAVRKRSATHANPDWDVDEWIIIPGTTGGTVDSSGMDPHEWVGEAECVFDLMITEITDNYNHTDARFVELFTRQDCARGLTIEDDLHLVVWRGDDSDPDHDGTINLKGKTIAMDGFLVFCASASHPYLPFQCDYIEPGTAADTDGTDSIALIEGDLLSGNFVVVDMFGQPGDLCQVPKSCFTGGRAYRKRAVISPNYTFDRDEWIITVPAGVDVNDPHIWKPEVPPPTNPPTKAPHTAPTSKKNGKGGKGKTGSTTGKIVLRY